MANECPVLIQCIDEDIEEVESLDEPLNLVCSNSKDYIVVRESFEWYEYDTTDWEVVGIKYRLIIPRSKHKCTNPFVDSMVILHNQNDIKYYPNIPVWHALANDSIVITSDEPIKCKVLIKGEQ